MILSDADIQYAQNHHQILEPFRPENVQPASVDLTLAEDFIVWEDMEVGFIQGGAIGSRWFGPGDFILASTIETVRVPDNLVGQVAGKSSLMRQGIQVCGDAGYIDPGFHGQITLELKHLGYDAILLKPGMKICQIVFTVLSSKASRPYGSAGLGSHYQNQEGATQNTED